MANGADTERLWTALGEVKTMTSSISSQVASTGSQVVECRSMLTGVMEETRRTADSCTAINGSLGALLDIEKAKLEHKQKIEETAAKTHEARTQWLASNWQLVALLGVMVFAPELLEKSAHLLGFGQPQQVIILGSGGPPSVTLPENEGGL